MRNNVIILQKAGFGLLFVFLQYQGNEYREDIGLNWMDFHNRQYDPQLGRFMGIDPMADAAGQQGLSPYHAMACNPSTLTDPLGLYVKGEAHNGGGAPDYGMEMLRRFPTMSNFMARYLDFGERTARQSMAEQQIEVQEFHRKQYEEATTGGGNAQESNAGTQIEKGAGVDYIFDGTSVSEETVANGLDENRIVIYKKRKKGETENEIRDMVPLGNRILPNHSTENKHSRFEFRNFGDGAIEVWDFFSRNSGNKWALTEYKVGNVVSSIIISKNHNMHSGVVFRNSKASDYIYWVTVHSHPRGGGIGLSDNTDDYEHSDVKMVDDIRPKFNDAQFNAYDIPNLNYARSFIKINRK